MPRAKAKSKQIGKTIAELAKHFARPHESMRAFCKDLPAIGKVGRAKTYDPKAVEKLIENKIERSAKPEDVKDLEKRKLRLQCEKLQVEIDEKLGKLIPVDDVRRFAVAHTEAVTMLARSLGGQLAPQLQGLSVARTEKVINAAGEELIAELRSMDWDE